MDDEALRRLIVAIRDACDVYLKESEGQKQATELWHKAKNGEWAHVTDRDGNSIPEIEAIVERLNLRNVRSAKEGGYLYRLSKTSSGKEFLWRKPAK